MKAAGIRGLQANERVAGHLRFALSALSNLLGRSDRGVAERTREENAEDGGRAPHVACWRREWHGALVAPVVLASSQRRAGRVAADALLIALLWRPALLWRCAGRRSEDAKKWGRSRGGVACEIAAGVSYAAENAHAKWRMRACGCK